MTTRLSVTRRLCSRSRSWRAAMPAAASAIRDHMATKRPSEADAGDLPRRFGFGFGFASPFRILAERRVQRPDQDLLGRLGAAPAALAGGHADPLPAGGPAAGAVEAGRVDEGLAQDRAAGVPLLPSAGQLAQRHRQRLRRQVVDADPWHHQEAAVRHREVQPAVAVGRAPPDPLVPGRQRPRRRLEQQHRESAARGGRGRTSGRTARRAAGIRDSGSCRRAPSTAPRPPETPPPPATGAPGPRDRRRSPAAGRRPARGRSARAPTSPRCRASPEGSGSRIPPGAREAAGPPRRGSRPSAWSSPGARRWSSTARCGCRSGTVQPFPGCRRSGAA